MLRLHTLLLATAVVGAAGSLARADELGASVSGSTSGASDTDRFTLPKGKLALDAFVEMNLSSGEAFKPVSITPDLWYGVTDDVTIGLVHSGVGATGFLDVVGNSLCITGTANGCGHVYNSVGLDGRIRIAKPWAVDVGLYISSISDPFQMAAKLGIDGRWTWNKVALELQPSIFLGLTNRESLEIRTAGEPCHSCHVNINPIGFGLESFDAVGATRTTDHGKPIDASGVLPGGKTFANTSEMLDLLRADERFPACVTKKMLTYALGRGMVASCDAAQIDALAAQLKADGYKLRNHLVRIVQSDMFRAPRARPEVTP